MTDGSGALAPPPPAPDAAEAGRSGLSPRRVVLIAAAASVLVASIVVLLVNRSGRGRRGQEALLKSTLDRLVTAQEGFYYDSSRYATSLRSLKALSVPPTVRLELTTPVSRSWSAVATHAGLRGRHCVVWVGTPPPPLPDAARVPENETKPLCFDDGPPVR